MTHHEEFLNLVKDAQTRIQEINVASLHQKLQSGEPFYLIDVREDGEWQLGHLPNAMHICKGILERDIVDKVPDLNATIVLYCGGGYRSALAADAIQKMGFTQVWSLQGGFRAWAHSGLAIEHD